MTMFPLPANQPETFYRGAGRIAAFRSGQALPDRPEDWVASTTSRFALAPSGLSTLPDGRLLAEAIAADPAWWLGSGPHRHRRSWSSCSTPASGCRCTYTRTGGSPRAPGLAVREDRGLGDRLGRTGRGGASGLHPRRVGGRAGAAGWPASRSTRCWPRPTGSRSRAGDAVLCPAGVPHAIGAGVFLVEIQEPTDFSVLLEYDGFALDGRPTATWGWATTWPWSASTAARGRRTGSRRCAAPRACCRPRPIRSSPPTGWAPGRCWGPRSRWWSSSPGPAR